MTQFQNKTTRKSALLAGLFAASLTSAASAYDLYVDDDGQQCPNSNYYNTIQEAVDNALPGCVIYVYPGTYTGSGSGAVVQVTSNNLHFIGIDDVVIDGEGVRRCARATGPTDNSGSIRFSNFTFENGDATGGNGGGVHVTGRVDFELCTVRDCVADNGGGIAVVRQGGAPEDEDSSIHMVLTTVRDCSAGTNGGGIYLREDSSMMLESCWVLNNSASKNGGGVAAPGGGGHLSILDYDCVLDPLDLTQGQLFPVSSFSGNSTAESGGGIYANGHRLYLQEVDILSNRAGESGGGVTLKDGWLDMGWRGEVLFAQNVAGEAPGVPVGDGGGLYVDNSMVLGDIFAGATPNPVIFRENIAYKRGGGVFATNCDKIELLATTFRGNRAYGNGGGMFVSKCLDFEVTASAFLFNFGKVAGALLIKDDGSGTYDIQNTALKFNIGMMNGGANGGALVVSGPGASAEVTSCEFDQNLKRHIMPIAGASLSNGGMNTFN